MSCLFFLYIIAAIILLAETIFLFQDRAPNETIVLKTALVNTTNVKKCLEVNYEMCLHEFGNSGNS